MAKIGELLSIMDKDVDIRATHISRTCYKFHVLSKPTSKYQTSHIKLNDYEFLLNIRTVIGDTVESPLKDIWDYLPRERYFSWTV